MKTKLNPCSISNLKHLSPPRGIPTRSLIPAALVTSFAKPTSKATRKASLLLFSVALLLAAGAAAVRGQSALDGFDPNADGVVRVVVVQPDGKILIGGYFNNVMNEKRPGIARLNPDGTLDQFFKPNATGGAVLSIAVQADGQVLAGGFFNSIGGLSRNYIARLHAVTGVADPLFDPNPDTFVSSIAVQQDGQILVGGSFNSFAPNHGSSITRRHIARLDATDPTPGVPDAFDPNADGDVGSIMVEPGRRILVGGSFNSFAPNQGSPVTRHHIARLFPNGRVDLPFNPNADNTVSSMAVQADGQILIAGSFTMLSPHGTTFARNHIARVDAELGSVDESFDPNADGDVGSIALQADGRILIGGGFTTLSPLMGPQVILRRIARLKPDGTPELSFNPNIPNTTDYVYSVAVQPDGKILAGGSFTTLEPNFGTAVTRRNIARLETDGRLDRTLDIGLFHINGAVEIATAVQPDGKILIGGYFTRVLGVERNHIARLNTDGTLDMDFDPHANDSVTSIAVQRDGQILIGGSFTGLAPPGGDAGTRNHIARLFPSGLLDPFDPNANGVVYSIVVQADDRILAGGHFFGLNSIGGNTNRTTNRIARLEIGGGLDTTFDANAKDDVNSIAVQADDKIIAGGGFHGLNSIGGNSGRFPNYIARLKPNGTLDVDLPIFDPNAGDVVVSIAGQADSNILTGGFFSNIGTRARNFIARLDAINGSADLAFDPSADNPVFSIALQADGKILAGGYFTMLSPNAGLPMTRHYIARLDATGSTAGIPDAFDPKASLVVRSIAVQSDGKILAGGNFESIGGQPRGRFARLTNDTAALQNLEVTGNTITWTRGRASPELTRATFEQSFDGGVTYTFLGNGVRVGTTGNFTLTGLSFPFDQNFWVRARGYYRSGQFNGSESITESVRNAFRPGTSIIGGGGVQNLSTRFQARTGDNVGIGGFIVTGTEPKHVLLRAIGPSLAQFGVPNALADPVLELHGPDAFVTITNNNWRDRQEAGILATGIPPTNDLESAIDATLDPGAYTALVAGNDNTSGVALVEVYDLDQTVESKLANISTRAFVSTGDNIVIAGFVLGNGESDSRIVVRGIGPSLTAFGVPNALANPTLELRDSDGALLVSNNDWQDDPAQAAELAAAGLAPTNPLESAVAMALPPGPYTALLRGLNNGTGVGLVEVYDRGAP